MRLHRLGFSNFGPFKGDQAIEFPDHNGVSVIYGDNNLGKTTILNSVRWLFVGKFLERTGKTRNDRELVNREAIAEAGGEPVAARVSATVTWRDEKYTLTRSATLDGDKLKPRLDVVRGSYALSAEEARETLQQMIPEEIQQFFLFDAEALNRYEDLLHDPTAGEELKNAIERILGVPVLENATQDLGSLTAKHTKVISRLETQDAKAKAAAGSLALLTRRLEKREEDIALINSRITDLENKKSDIEQQMASSDKARFLLESHRRAEQAHQSARAELDDARQKFRDVAPQAWTAVLTPTLTSKLDELRAEHDKTELEQRAFDRERLLGQLRAELIETGECPCCGQPAHDAHVEKIHSLHDQSAKLADIRSRIASIERVLDPATVARLDERDRVLQDKAMKAHDRASDLADAAEEIEGLDDTQLLDLPTRLSNTKHQLRNLRTDLRDARKERDDDREQATLLAARIAEHGGEAGAAATKKQDLLTSLQHLCSAAIDNYREMLKERVEREATDVFVSIRSDPDFVGLSINKDYGLSILHKDGALEPQRSAGYEHIVALSLVAALQRCAPVQGPIFMDMPFARLDPNHTLTTLEALPAIAEQVVLIVHEGEINHDEAQRTLRSSLVCERRLTRRSARHTDIVKLGST